ncbi:MAG TPA: hypothetical protein DCS55_08225 [Acidimicrobiaceae bacterium]|nr:hypothetical protein [Acidimicrobiaceae bacterium]
MADDGGPDGVGRFIVGVVGLCSLGGAALAFQEDEVFASTLVVVGAVLVVVAVVLPRVHKMKLPGGGEITLRERDAAALAADAATTVDDVSREIASTEDVAPAPSAQDPDVTGTLNYVAGNMSLQAVFDWTTAADEPLAGCQLRLYLLDEEDGVLRAVLAPPDAHNATTWRIGQGATGTAYESGDYVLVTGADVSSSTYGLDEEQQQRFRRLAAVAAAPVVNAGGRIVGVVTASTSDLDNSLDSEDARRDHTLAALLVGRVLVELLQWFDDEP